MDKIDFTNKKIPALNDKTLNKLQENIEKSLLIKDVEIYEEDVTEEESKFTIPENYFESTSIVEVYINDRELAINEYKIQDDFNGTYSVNLINPTSNSKVKIKCLNVSKGFENLIKKLIEKNSSVG